MSAPRMGWVDKTVRKRSDLVLRSGLPAWIIRALRDSGIKRLSILAGMSDTALLIIPGIGQRSVALIREEIARAADPTGDGSRGAHGGHGQRQAH